MNRNNPVAHFLPAPLDSGLRRIVQFTGGRARWLLGVELAIGVGCEVALEIVNETVLNVSMASGLGIEAAAAVGLGLVFGLRRL